MLAETRHWGRKGRRRKHEHGKHHKPDTAEQHGTIYRSGSAHSTTGFTAEDDATPRDGSPRSATTPALTRGVSWRDDFSEHARVWRPRSSLSLHSIRVGRDDGASARGVKSDGMGVGGSVGGGAALAHPPPPAHHVLPTGDLPNEDFGVTMSDSVASGIPGPLRPEAPQSDCEPEVSTFETLATSPSSVMRYALQVPFVKVASAGNAPDSEPPVITSAVISSQPAQAGPPGAISHPSLLPPVPSLTFSRRGSTGITGSPSRGGTDGRGAIAGLADIGIESFGFGSPVTSAASGGSPSIAHRILTQSRTPKTLASGGRMPPTPSTPSQH